MATLSEPNTFATMATDESLPGALWGTSASDVATTWYKLTAPVTGMLKVQAVVTRAQGGSPTTAIVRLYRDPVNVQQYSKLVEQSADVACSGAHLRGEVNATCQGYSVVAGTVYALQVRPPGAPVSFPGVCVCVPMGRAWALDVHHQLLRGDHGGRHAPRA